jgi:hypothetical protein
MGIKYDNATSGSGPIMGTLIFAPPDAKQRGKNRIDRNYARGNTGDGNGKSVTFIITIDPSNRFTLGISRFTTSAVAWGIHMGTFTEGTEWMSPTGRVRIMGGKLRYTSSRRLYPLPEIREATG